MKDFIYERFNSIYEFEKTLNSRKTNSAFGRKPASKRVSSDDGWYQTATYSDADNLLEKGWNAQVEGMKVELQKFSSQIDAVYNKQIKHLAGYAPCVPNAIRGVPKSMFATKKINKTENRRVLHIIFNNTAAGRVKAEDLMQSGMTLLKLVTVLDKKHVKTKLEVIPKMSAVDDSIYGCSVMIKDYNQPFNLSKMAYPLAHVGFFRRHGFRFLETVEGFKNTNFVEGYGHSMIYTDEKLKNEYFKYAGFLKEGTVYIDFNDVKNADFDWEKLAKNKGIAL